MREKYILFYTKVVTASSLNVFVILEDVANEQLQFESLLGQEWFSIPQNDIFVLRQPTLAEFE